MKSKQQRKQLTEVYFRGTRLRKKDLTTIQKRIASGEFSSRQALAREICRTFHWRRPNGELAIRGAWQLLVRLDKIGFIRLPNAKGLQGRPRHEAVAEAASRIMIPENLESFSRVTESKASQEICSELRVRLINEEERLDWRAHIERFHYLGDAGLVGESLRYVAELNGKWVALLSWGAATLCNRPRDNYIGWDKTAKKTRLNLVVNNARFLILPWGQQPNLASRILATNLRRLSHDWKERYGHPVVLAETFVDSSRFRGTCYRASNWIEVGRTRGFSRRGAGYEANGKPKAIFLYPLIFDFKKQLCTGQNTYMKKEGIMALDIEKLPLNGEGGLFEVLRKFTDPRKPRGIRHKIQSVLSTAICAVLAGARSFIAIEEWAAEQTSRTLVKLGSIHGTPPSERTYRRVFSSIDVQKLDSLIGGWFTEQHKLLPGAGLALDGKTVRGSSDGDNNAIHLLSAIVHNKGTVVSQVAVESKTNEITKVELLLDNLDIDGVVVTADALHTQKKTAEHLVETKKAEYVFVAKDNQPTLRQDIEDLGLDGFPPSA